MEGLASRDAREELTRRFRRLVILAWWLPVGVSVLLQSFLGFWTLREAALVLGTLTGLYCLGWTVLAVRILGGRLSAILDEVEAAEAEGRPPEAAGLRRLPLLFLGLVLLYVGCGPLVAYANLELLTDNHYTLEQYAYASFGALPSVLITVFPIWFRSVDLLGASLAPRGVEVPLAPLWQKLAVLGLASPVLIDVVLLIYYEDRTGFVKAETLALWFSLLVIAGVGTALAARSLGQSLEPLRRAASLDSGELGAELAPRSLDEIGAITAAWVRQLEAHRQAEERLRTTQRMEAIGQLTGGVAHDLNNLLTVILTSLQLIRRKDGDPRVQEFVDDALQASDRCAQLTRSLLTFARQRPLRPEPLQLRAALVASRGMLRSALGDRVTLNVDVDPDTPPVLLDPAELDHTLINLCTNARDALDGPGRVRLRAEPVTLDAASASDLQLAPGRWVRLVFEDDGPGIPAELLSRVCEPFFTTKPPGRGTGLGLASVHGFVRQSGGHLGIESPPEGGARFVLHLPLATADAATRSPPRGVRRVGPCRILLVEDEPSVRRIVREALSGLGHQVYAVESAAEALAQFDPKRPPALLVTDVLLGPGRTGPELARELTAAAPDLRVLFVSGYPRDELAGRGGHLDPDVRLLQKPFTIDQLLAEVGELLGNAEAA